MRMFLTVPYARTFHKQTYWARAWQVVAKTGNVSLFYLHNTWWDTSDQMKSHVKFIWPTVAFSSVVNTGCPPVILCISHVISTTATTMCVSYLLDASQIH
jgi:hypothetical protein